MKLVNFYRSGQVRLGGVCRDGVGTEIVYELAGDLVGLLGTEPAALEQARRALEFAKGNLRDGLPIHEVDLRAPVERPGKIICVGLNYHSHLALLDEDIPDWPILFMKPSTSVIGSGQPIVLPSISREVDYEGELAVIIGSRGKNIRADEALAHIAGYTCANDVSAHDIEFRTSQWTSGKMLDTFCPLGPAMITADEIEDPNCLSLQTRLNGEIVQDSNTSNMRFSVAYLVSYISSLATLEPGDVILTGTPAGIGCMRDPQVFLQPGDRISVEIEGVGELSNPVEAE